MLSTAGSALVAGAPPHAMKTIDIIVTRPFLHKAERQPIGKRLTLEFAIGCELISANKAARAPAAPQDAPAEVKPAAPAAKSVGK